MHTHTRIIDQQPEAETDVPKSETKNLYSVLCSNRSTPAIFVSPHFNHLSISNFIQVCRALQCMLYDIIPRTYAFGCFMLYAFFCIHFHKYIAFEEIYRKFACSTEWFSVEYIFFHSKGMVVIQDFILIKMWLEHIVTRQSNQSTYIIIWKIKKIIRKVIPGNINKNHKIRIHFHMSSTSIFLA